MGASLLAKFVTFFIIKPEQKSLTHLQGEGSQWQCEEKRVEYWAIFDISILLLAVALGHISAQETLHCHRGGRKRRRAEMEMGIGKAEYSDGLRGVKAMTEWQQSESSSNSIFLLQASSLMVTGSRKHHENRHSSLWAQGESPITLQLIGEKKKVSLDGWMLKGTMSSLPWPQDGNARDSGRESTGWWRTKWALREDKRSRE